MKLHKHLKKKVELLDINNKQVSLTSVISFYLPLYIFTILFGLFALIKQEDEFFGQHYILNDNTNDCVSMVTVSEYGIIQFSSIKEEKDELGDLFSYLSCRENGPKDYRNYLKENENKKLTF